MIFVATQSSIAQGDPSLWQIARASLEHNLVTFDSTRIYLTAGARQFKALWVRDFCHSTRGLLAIGRHEALRSGLDLILDHVRVSDGLVPRVLDSSPTQLRVMLATIGIRLPFREALRPRYMDEHGSEAIDSNLLVLLSAYDYATASGDWEWWRKHEATLVRLLRYYESHRDGLLIRQTAFSDWQDSVKREGRTFYVNLLYFTVLSRLATFQAFGIDGAMVDAVRAEIDTVFLDAPSGIYRSIGGEGYLSLDGNLLALDFPEFFRTTSAKARHYEALKASPLWAGYAGMPGANTVPRYPTRWKTPAVRIAGLAAYHDRAYWSWLMALSAKISHAQGDAQEADRILQKIEVLVRRDRGVAEIYSPSPQLPVWRSRFYRAEIPFSWGAAYLLDLLVARGLE